MSKFHTIVEPMQLIREREANLVAEYERRVAEGKPVYVAPTAFNVGKMEAAARAHARVNMSDPFAYGRMMMKLRRGIESPFDVLKDSNSILAMRQEAKLRHYAKLNEAS